MKTPQNTLNLKNKLKENSIKGLALDIDETLSWTVGYWMEEMSKRFGNPDNLSVADLIKKYRYSQNVPYWQTDESKSWIEKARHSDKLQEELPLIKNSNLVVQKINKIVPIVAYITTRPDTTLNGTRKWLEKYNFPSAEIIARSANIPALDGNKWKAEVLEFLYPEVTGIIDDNSGLIDFLSKNYKGIVYLYDNVDHPKKSLRIIPCPSWNDVFNKIKAI